MKKLKAAVIGAGQIAKISHLPYYQGLEQVELAGICDVRRKEADKLAEQFQIPNVYTDHLTMLKELKPDLVSICVPNKLHCKFSVDALNAGCHVLCEKPPAINPREAEEMEETALKCQKLLSYGFHMRYAPQVTFLKNKIEAGELGQIYRANAIWLRRRGIPGWGSFTNKEIQGGGPLIDIGAHVLDVAFYLLNYPEIDYVCADSYNLIGKKGGAGFFGEWSGEGYTVEDSLFGTVRFRNGSSLHVECSFALNMKEKDKKSVALFGDKMGAEVFPLELFGQEQGQSFIQSFPFCADEDFHKAEIEHFVKACLGEEKLLVTPQQGTYLQRVISALYESADTGRPVKLN